VRELRIYVSVWIIVDAIVHSFLLPPSAAGQGAPQGITYVTAAQITTANSSTWAAMLFGNPN